MDDGFWRFVINLPTLSTVVHMIIFDQFKMYLLQEVPVNAKFHNIQSEIFQAFRSPVEFTMD